MELWDVYDNCFQKTGKTHVRGVPMEKGEHHLTVHIYPVNDKGEILIQKRASTVKLKPGFWAATGGSVVAGEDAFLGCQRELKEEVGLEATKENTKLLGILKKEDRFRSIWMMRCNTPIEQLVLQAEEVAEAKWVKPQRILDMIEEGIFWPCDYLDWLFRQIEKEMYPNVPCK